MNHINHWIGELNPAILLLLTGHPQVSDITRFATLRVPLMAAFRANLAGRYPTGTTQLSDAGVQVSPVTPPVTSTSDQSSG